MKPLLIDELRVARKCEELERIEGDNPYRAMKTDEWAKAHQELNKALETAIRNAR